MLTKPIHLNSAIVLLAVGLEIVRALVIWDVDNRPPLSNNKSKTLTLSIDAVDKTTLMIKGISSMVIKVLP